MVDKPVLKPAAAVIDPQSAAVFAAMLEKPLRQRIAPWTGIRADVAARLGAAHAELARAGDEWRASQSCDGNLVRLSPPSTETAEESLHMKINTDVAAELLDRTPSRVRQLLRSGELGGELVGRRWSTTRGAVIEYVRKAA